VPGVAAVREKGARPCEVRPGEGTGQPMRWRFVTISSSASAASMPRVEAHDLDLPVVLRAKALRGLLLFYFTDRLREAKRSRE
jgi:hypothetical protein